MCGHLCLTKHITSSRQIVDTAINKNQTEYKTYICECLIFHKSLLNMLNTNLKHEFL